MIELRYNTSQYMTVGVLQAKKARITDPNAPLVGAVLSSFAWHRLILQGGSSIDIVARPWYNVPNCAGCYSLGLATSDVNLLGILTLYIFDPNALQDPIFIRASVVPQNYYDSKYGSAKLIVEPSAMKG